MLTHAARIPIAIYLFTCVPAAPAWAQTAAVAFDADRPNRIGIAAFAGVTFLVAQSAQLDRHLDLRLERQTDPAQSGSPRPTAFEYSEGYKTRAKIHRYASFATLPLFAAQGFLGQSLYNNPTDAKRTAHMAVATGIGALFGVNAVTGVWNLMEARHDPNRHTLRTVHSVLMLTASGLFTATAAQAPINGGGNREVHRGLAAASIGTATAGYLIMLFGSR